MTPLALVLLALAMSSDAFAAAIGKGLRLRQPRLLEALRIGVIFGSIEALMPVAGWMLGNAAAHHVVSWDHWIAFVLLLILGLHMIRNGLRGADVGAPPIAQPSLLVLVTAAIATSIDALVVGIGLAFVDVSIVLAAGAIGLATTLMVTLGILLGRVIGTVAGQRAEIGGGGVLILIGSSILYEHLTHPGLIAL